MLTTTSHKPQLQDFKKYGGNQTTNPPQNLMVIPPYMDPILESLDFQHNHHETTISLSNATAKQVIKAINLDAKSRVQANNTITFSVGDIPHYMEDKECQLYVAAQINDVTFKRAFIDTGTSLNIIPKSTIEEACVNKEEIIHYPTTIYGYNQIGHDNYS